MSNSQKTVYIIAFIAIVILLINIFTNYRFYNGSKIQNERLIAFNVDDPHGVAIAEESKWISFESGIGYNLEVADLPLESGNVVSLVIPIDRLTPNTVYQASMSFEMVTNNVENVNVESNSKVDETQVSIQGDINYKPVTIKPGSDEYNVQINFETNSEGKANIILNFEVSDNAESFKANIANLQFSNFLEVAVSDNIDEQQVSETSIEIK